jgi:hypothetical protein
MRSRILKAGVISALVVAIFCVMGRQRLKAFVKSHVLPKGNFRSASLHGKRVFPENNPWNSDISALPVDPASEVLVGSIGMDKSLHPDFGTVYKGIPMGIPYMLVPGTQPRVKVEFEYANASDPGPYPIPPNPLIEGGPDSKGDRHVLLIDQDHWMLYELYSARYDATGWKAGSGAIFDLTSNKLRPAGWTSADAAGLPIFPGLVRYDEVMEQKAIRHALRFTVVHTRRAYISPARHFASHATDFSLPPLGMRVRLKANYDISGFPPAAQVILKALKKYGMILADNGSNWFLSGAPDSRWDDGELAALKRVHGHDFEVVRMGPVVTE